MGQKSIQKILKESFSTSDAESWKKTATSELDGSEPFTKLSWISASNISFLPFYDQTNILSHLRDAPVLLPPSGDPVYGSRKWLNMPIVTVTDEVTANEIALNYLSSGADGILFDLIRQQNPDLSKLLLKIEWPYCRLAFKGANSSALQPALVDYFQQYKPDSSFAGNLFIKDSDEVAPLMAKAKDFKSLSFWIDSSTEVEEIVTALKVMAEAIDALDGQSPVVQVIDQISFSISLDADFLSTIAKVKALRRLWYQVVCAYGINSLQPGDLHIHGRSSSYTNEIFQPNANMLKSTIAAMAGIIGGVDSLTIEAEDADNVVMNRIARNVSNILREESYFDKVSDPSAGAYAIEEMTEQISKHAWQMFQNDMKR